MEAIDIQWIIQLVFSILSILGCTFIISSFFFIKVHKVHYQYVFCLAISQLILALNGLAACIFYSVGFEFHDEGKTAYCKIQAILLTIGQKSGWMYVSLISYTLSRGHTDNYMKSKGKWIHTASWLAINALFVGVTWSHMGPAPDFPIELCWTADGRYVYYSLYIPMAIFGIFNAGCIFYIIIGYVKDFRKNKEIRTHLLTARKDSKVIWFLLRIAFYPCIFLSVAVTMSIGRFCYHLNSEKYGSWAPYLTQSVFLEGFFCAVAYGFTPSLRNQYPYYIYDIKNQIMKRSDNKEYMLDCIVDYPCRHPL